MCYTIRISYHFWRGQVFRGNMSRSMAFWKSREISDAAVILSIAVLASVITIYMDGFANICEAARANAVLHLDRVATTLLFLAMAMSVFGIRRIIDQRKELARRLLAERRVQALAFYDPLTRLPNRVHLEHELAALLNKQGSPSVTLFLVKLNGYAGINDLYGYAG